MHLFRMGFLVRATRIAKSRSEYATDTYREMNPSAIAVVSVSTETKYTKQSLATGHQCS